MQKYQQAILIRSALFEVSGFVSAAAALLTNDVSFLLFSLVALVLLLLYRPSRISFLNEAEVSTKELEMIKNTSRKP
jgi:membrane protein implicated in regulation of membrane protease activity